MTDFKAATFTSIAPDLRNIGDVSPKSERIKTGGMIKYLEGVDGKMLLREIGAHYFLYFFVHPEVPAEWILDPDNPNNIVDRAMNVLYDIGTDMYTVMAEAGSSQARIDVFFIPSSATTAVFREFIDQYLGGFEDERYVPPYRTMAEQE